MTRIDDDSWDITESVVATALGVAMVRAAESDCSVFVEARLNGYSESWNSTTAATESTASLSAASRSAADGAASTE